MAFVKNDHVDGGPFAAADENAHADQTNTNTTDITGKQAGDSDLTAIAALSPSNNDFIQRKSGAWANRTVAEVKTDLAITKTDVGLGSVTNNAQYYAGGTDVAIADGGTGVSTLPTGILKGAGTSAITVATAGTDYLTPTGSAASLTSFPTFNQNTTGSAAALTTARTFQTNLASTAAPTFDGSAACSPGVTGTLPVANGGTGVATLTGIAKASGTSAFTAAVAGTDYVAPGGALGTPSSGTLTNCTAIPYDLSIVGVGASTTRAASSYGDFPFGVKLQRAVTLSSVTFRVATADASGNLVCELRKNGSQISGTSTSIAAAGQVAGGTSTGTWSCAAGDIITVYITAIGTTPGKGLIADVKGVTD